MKQKSCPQSSSFGKKCFAFLSEIDTKTGESEGTNIAQAKESDFSPQTVSNSFKQQSFHF